MTTIRTRLTWQFTIIVASLLICFLLTIYLFYGKFRRDEFYSRLETKALTTARLLISVQEIDHDLLKIIDRNTLNALHNEKILIYNRRNQLIYTSIDDMKLEAAWALLQEIRANKRVEYTEGDNEVLGLTYDEGGRNYVILASAFDIYGRRKLANLRALLLIGGFISLLVTYLAGRLFAGQALYPISQINQQVSAIGGETLAVRLPEGNGKDEIAQLAANFNRMLDRIALAFSLQRTFVNNASHELRTPLAAITSQLQVGLSKPRNTEEYRKLLHSVLEDTRQLTILSNSLLSLAKAEAGQYASQLQPLRIDEVVFNAQETFCRQQPDCRVEIDFDTIPEQESELTVMGHEGMLSTLFINLLENACKFSSPAQARIGLASHASEVVVTVQDRGIGIAREELPHIFSPLYRASNAQQIAGYGLGLSICQRIVQRHGGSLRANSELGKGSEFKVTLPTQTQTTA